jgi:hypothetical protein
MGMVLLCAILEQLSSLSATCRTAGCTVCVCVCERERGRESLSLSLSLSLQRDQNEVIAAWNLKRLDQIYHSNETQQKNPVFNCSFLCSPEVKERKRGIDREGEGERERERTGRERTEREREQRVRGRERERECACMPCACVKITCMCENHMHF